SISGYAHAEASRRGRNVTGDETRPRPIFTGPGGATTATLADGSYTFSSVTAGTYSVSAPATASGYALFTMSPLSVTIAAGASSRSEERRVGKEWISGYAVVHGKRKVVQDV